MSNNGDGVACTCDLDPCLCAASRRAFRLRRDTEEVIVPESYPVTFRTNYGTRDVVSIHDAARSLDVDGIRQALAAGVSPDLRHNTFGRTALHFAAAAVSEQDNFSLSSREYYPFDPLVRISVDRRVGEEDVAVQLKVRSLRVTVRGEVLLDSPLKGRCIDPVQCSWLLDYTSGQYYRDSKAIILRLRDLDAKTWPRRLERTLPGLAAPQERAEACVAALIQAGASVNIKDNDGLTPLHCAGVFPGRPGVCQMLCAAGADVDARNAEGWTPLSYAISSSDCIAVLLAAGARVDVVTVAPHRTLRRTPWCLYRQAIHNGVGDRQTSVNDIGNWPCTQFGFPDPRAYPLFLRAGATFSCPKYFRHYHRPSSQFRMMEQYVQRVAAAGGFPAYERAHLVRVTKTVESKLGLPARPARLVVEYWLHAGFY